MRASKRRASGIGAPDLKYRERDRRQGRKVAPRVDFIQDWAKTLMMRAEGQWRRDLVLPFAVSVIHQLC